MTINNGSHFKPKQSCLTKGNNQMSTFTLNNVLSQIKTQIREYITYGKSQDEINELSLDDAIEILEDNHYYGVEVIYTYDAWEIVAGSSFNEYSPMDTMDFTGCESSLDCVFHEACEIMNSVYYSERNEIISDLLSELQD